MSSLLNSNISLPAPLNKIVSIFQQKKYRIWISLFVLSVISFQGVPIVSSQGCDQRQINRCLDILRPFSDFLSISYGFTEEDLRVKCIDYTGAVRCIEELRNLCFTEHQKRIIEDNFGGVTNTVYQLCGDTPLKREMMSYSSCLHSVEPTHRHCGREYADKLRYEGMGPDEYGDTMLRKCCAFEEFLNCTRPVYMDQCGYDATRLMERLVRNMEGKSSVDTCTNMGDCSTAAMFTTYNPTSTLFGFAIIIVMVSKWS